jgi:hypothetical protein
LPADPAFCPRTLATDNSSPSEPTEILPALEKVKELQKKVEIYDKLIEESSDLHRFSSLYLDPPDREKNRDG